MTTTDEKTDIYMLDEKGKLFRAGKHIGDLQDDDGIKLLPEFSNFKASVARWLRQKADQEDVVEAQKAAAPKLTPKEQEAEDAKILAEAHAATNRISESYKDDLDFAKRTGCPSPPKKNPQFNDKTPAYVEWLERYRLDKFKQVFGVRSRGKRAIVKLNPETGIEEVAGYEDCWIADRKCHLTERSNDRKGLTDDMDWDA
jgi:hypothetical protein